MQSNFKDMIDIIKEAQQSEYFYCGYPCTPYKFAKECERASLTMRMRCAYGYPFDVWSNSQLFREFKYALIQANMIRLTKSGVWYFIGGNNVKTTNNRAYL